MKKLALVTTIGLLVVVLGQVPMCFAQYRWNSKGTRTDIQPNWSGYFQQKIGYTQYNQKCNAPVSPSTLKQFYGACGGGMYPSNGRDASGPNGVGTAGGLLLLGARYTGIAECGRVQAQVARERCDPIRQPITPLNATALRGWAR